MRRSTKYLWPNGTVYYKFDASIVDYQAKIREAMDHIVNKSLYCVSFREVTNDNISIPYVLIIKTFECRAIVGKSVRRCIGLNIKIENSETL